MPTQAKVLSSEGLRAFLLSLPSDLSEDEVSDKGAIYVLKILAQERRQKQSQSEPPQPPPQD